MFELSSTVPDVYPQPKSSLINRLTNDRLLGVIQMSPQLINIVHARCADSVYL